MDYPRTLARHIVEASRHFPVLMVTGARQVGKTTLLRSLCAAERHYVSLDDPLVLSLARADPALFLQRYPPPLLIDEVQYAPELLPHIKMAVDAARHPGLYWLTGSQPFHLMKGVSESLAGRVAVINLLGFSHRESLRQGDLPLPPFLPEPEVLRQWQASSAPLALDALYARIWRGAFPVLAVDAGMSSALFHASYLQTYLQRDVRDLARVGDEMAFLRFIKAAAARTGQLLNIAELSRDADVAPNTGKHWLSILEASGLVYLLQPWHGNVTKRLIKTPKLYFLDTGLAAYLTQWSSSQTLEAGAMSGAMFETWVVGELLKSYWHGGRQAPFYFFRNKDQREIDVLIESDGKLYPIECKKSAAPGRDALAPMLTLANLGVPLGPGAVISMVSAMLPLSHEVMAVPAWVL